MGTFYVGILRETYADVPFRFAELVNSTFSASLASDILASGFQDFSDSINFLTGQPYGSATFNGLAAFDAGQSGQTPVPFTILETVQQCTTLVIRWVSKCSSCRFHTVHRVLMFPQVAYPGAQPARGFTLMHTVQGNGTANGWQIQTQYAEFNVAAWDNDTPGGNCVAPPPPSAAGTSTTSSVLVPTPATSTGAAVAPTAAA